MKLTLFLLAALTTLVSTADINKSEAGWFVPQPDDTLTWVTHEQHVHERNAAAAIQPRAATDVKFFLYTKSNPSKPKQIATNDASTLSASNFNKAHPTRFIIHGWGNDYNSDVNVEVRSAFLATGSFNVFCVDWSAAAGTLNYNSARYSVGEVGKLIADFIDFLNLKGGMTFASVNVIGHSLGAHVAGYTGKNVKRGKIHSIVGLDPAWPLFSYSDCATRLCSTDAAYVESIQTNGGLKGFLQPIGKGAFYPNGGKVQPGCGTDLMGVCAHSRSYVYYAESVRKNDFPSMKCATYENAVDKACGSTYSSVRMGPAAYGAAGYFYVPVKSSPPYGMG